jgi:dihydrodipicolinate synthase/N-acetylneuraminate lyase
VTNPVPIKYAVNRAGMDIGGTRLPLWGPDEAFKARFDPVMDDYDIDLPVD